MTKIELVRSARVTPDGMMIINLTVKYGEQYHLIDSITMDEPEDKSGITRVHNITLKVSSL